MVAGFDDILEGGRLPYRLTTVRQPIDEMVEETLEILHLDDPTRPIERASTGRSWAKSSCAIRCGRGRRRPGRARRASASSIRSADHLARLNASSQRPVRRYSAASRAGGV